MIRFNSMPNFRELTTKDEKSEKNSLKLYRSSRPDWLTMDEVEQFKRVGIKCIIDCRSATEYRKATGHKLLDEFYSLYKVKLPFFHRFKPDENVRSVCLKTAKGRFKSNFHGAVKDQNENAELGRHFLIDFFNLNYVWTVFNRAPWYMRIYSLLFLLVDVILNTGFRYFVRLYARNVLNKEGLIGQYYDMINYSQASICSALKLLSDPSNVPAMLNCAHGKDRTGIVSALVLSCLGRSKEFIAEDYAKSALELEPIKGQVHEDIVGRFHMCQTFTSANSESMMKVLDYIDASYGSVPNYLESIGFLAKDQEKLRQNLTSI